MSKKNLGKARGLNSIADPSDFRGKSARPPRKARNTPAENPEHTHSNPEQPTEIPVEGSDADIDLRDSPSSTPTGKPTDSAGKAPSTGDQSKDGPSGRPADRTADGAVDGAVDSAANGVSSDASSEGSDKPRRGRPPVTANRRIRRELSVPVAVADAVEQTGVNPADLVMNAYRRHSDDVYTGDGARMAARGRKRLRVSLSDGDFDKITRLGEVRNWNRSETVSVLLSLDLLTERQSDA